MTAQPRVMEPGGARSRAAKPAAGLSPGASKRRRRGRIRGRLTVAAFLAPALTLFSLMVLAPIAIAVYTSLFKWSGYKGAPMEYIGLGNFQRMLEDDIFLGDLQHGAILIVLSLVVQLPLALALALLLNQELKGKAVYRLLFFAPYVLSEVITAVLFLLVLSPSQGIASYLTDEGWLDNPSSVLYAVFFVITWKYFGFYMILFLAARQSIPNELTEAASIDGAGAWQAFRRVTLPLMGPTIRIGIFLSVIGTIQLFDMVWVFTGGGPVNASETMAITMYRYGFKRHEVGYASAISIAMFLLSFVFALMYQRFVMRRDVEGATTVMRDVR